MRKIKNVFFNPLCVSQHLTLVIYYTKTYIEYLAVCVQPFSLKLLHDFSFVLKLMLTFGKFTQTLCDITNGSYRLKFEKSWFSDLLLFMGFFVVVVFGFFLLFFLF